jgi:hypothetical protein
MDARGPTPRYVNWYDQMLFNCRILLLLSLPGTSPCVYCGDLTSFVAPIRIVSCHATSWREWNFDIVSPDGLAKMQAIVAYIKVEAANDVHVA